MYKKNRQDMIKLFLLIIFILILPLFFILLETVHSLRTASNIKPEDILTNSLDEIYENISSIPKNNYASDIRKCLTEIFELMNERDYSKLYSLLTDDIKALMFASEEVFGSYMEAYLADELYTPKFEKFEKINNQENDIFILRVYFMPYSTSKEDISSSLEAYKSDIFTIYFNEDSTYNFSFLKYIGRESSNKPVYENDLFACNLTTDLYTSQTTFHINITNKTDIDMFIGEKEIYVITGLVAKYYSPSTFIWANSTSKIDFTIYTGLNLKESLPYTIHFRGINTDGKSYFFTLPIRYPLKLSSIQS